MTVSTRFHSLPAGRILLALLVCAGLFLCDRDAAVGQPPPPPVVTMTAETSDAVVYRNYPARIHSARQVQVRARVAGILEKRRYREGEAIEKGAVLFEIDSESFEIELRRAEAELSTARAQYRHAEKQWTRYSRLYAQESVSEGEYDRAKTDYALARARMDLAGAMRDDARRNLRYTKVRAPVAGVTAIESVSEGNLIEYGQRLTTITQQDPVHIRFAIPETDALLLRAARRAIAPGDGSEPKYKAWLIMADGTEYRHKGDIDFTAGTIDAETGSVAARAVFPNPDDYLVPGQFVRVRIRVEDLQGVFMIPEAAIGQGREGAHVFVVDDENIARIRPVRLGPVREGRQALLEGIDTGEKVVINGHVALRDGMKVSISGSAEGPAGEGAR